MKTIFKLLTFIFAACGAALLASVPPGNPLPFIAGWLWNLSAVFLYAVLAGAFTACFMVEIGKLVLATAARYRRGHYRARLVGRDGFKWLSSIAATLIISSLVWLAVTSLAAFTSADPPMICLADHCTGSHGITAKVSP